MQRETSIGYGAPCINRSISLPRNTASSFLTVFHPAQLHSLALRSALGSRCRTLHASLLLYVEELVTLRNESGDACGSSIAIGRATRWLVSVRRWLSACPPMSTVLSCIAAGDGTF